MSLPLVNREWDDGLEAIGREHRSPCQNDGEGGFLMMRLTVVHNGEYYCEIILT